MGLACPHCVTCFSGHQSPGDQLVIMGQGLGKSATLSAWHAASRDPSPGGEYWGPVA